MEQQLPDVSGHDDFRHGPAPGGGGEKLTIAYLKQVEDMFQDQRERYETLLGVTEDFKAQRVNVTEAIARVKELLKGHDELIFGFNAFLPKGSEITVIDEPQQKKTVSRDEAMGYVSKVKTRFVNDYRVYESFVDIMVSFRNEDRDVDEIYQELAKLFDDHIDLLDDFSLFLPKHAAARLTHQSANV